MFANVVSLHCRSRIPKDRSLYSSSRMKLKSYVEMSDMPSSEQERQLMTRVTKVESRCRTTKLECLAFLFVWGHDKAAANRKDVLKSLLEEYGSFKLSPSDNVHPLIWKEIKIIMGY